VSDLLERVTLGLAEARARIAGAGGDPERVTVVAVTKGFGLDAVQAALAAGLDQVGENYAAELIGKSAELAGGGGAAPTWHYLGSVQRRKVRALAPVVSCWQSVARLVEGEEIARRCPGARVLVEVEATGLPGRQGAPVPAVPALVAALVDLGLTVEGLMTVAGPGGGSPAEQVFATVVELADDLGLPVRSMGMSGDLEEAVRSGSTMVRLGTALFGPRPTTRGLAQ
jgi:uncharacterized pyridoxal phosphate-containing UPF0001 family protein